ncbi:VTT domain-containing protein [Granulicella sp. dw_53]|uniref:YqaA family protein n=1 Tax=Granulicella sp. dw_53 TaxID=2719792 RepID=UPI001BD1E9A6
MKLHPIALFHKLNLGMLTLLKPLGIWGIGALAIIDSSSIPVPIDAFVIDYVIQDHSKFILYCLMAAVGSAIGSLVPYYIGRAGGELFLLKRINRQRYEQLRDRFEKQEFLAIMIPAMMPPPMPVKLVEIAAGVFEMKPLWFFCAIAMGKFVRFMLWSILIILYGPAIIRTITNTLHHHLTMVLSLTGAAVALIVVYVLRKLFDRRRGTAFPAEEDNLLPK